MPTPPRTQRASPFCFIRAHPRSSRNENHREGAARQLKKVLALQKITWTL